LSKLFGGNSKKKEDDHVEGGNTTFNRYMIIRTNVSNKIDHSRYVAATSETATSKQNDTPATPAVDPESKEAGPSSPTLGRRVTGFFAKRIPSHKRQNKDKAEVSTGQETMADSTTASGHRDAETSATTNGKDQANKESSPTSAVAAANIATEVANVTTTNTATTVA
jgi:hypothetical protein